MFIELEYHRAFYDGPQRTIVNVRNICRLGTNREGEAEITFADGSIITLTAPYDHIRKLITEHETAKQLGDLFGR